MLALKISKKGGGDLANQSKEEKVKEAISSPNDIDLECSVMIKQIVSKTEKKYKCTTCGSSWDSQKGHFSMSKSILFQANNGYITMCNTCRDEYFRQLCILYKGNEPKAIQYMCTQFGWFFHEDAVTASRQISSDRSRISHYLAKKNLGQTSSIGITDIDTIKHEYQNDQANTISSIEEYDEKKANGEVSISKTTLKRWGIGVFEDPDYAVLEEHYKMLKENNPNADNNQEIFIKSLCHLNMLMIKALKDKDLDGYTKANGEYAKTFKQAGLKTVEEKDLSNDETFCMTLGFISDYTPEEFYQDKELYKDSDGIGDYIERHVTRPMINLETGSSIRDKEFFVPETDDDYDEE